MKKFIHNAIHAVKDEIDQHPFQRKSTVDMASDAGIGINLLQKGFKNLFKVNVFKYQQKRRMEGACDLLDNGNMTMKQVADKCGYNNQGNFSYAFKKIHGITPTEYQNRA